MSPPQHESPHGLAISIIENYSQVPQESMLCNRFLLTFGNRRKNPKIGVSMLKRPRQYLI
jgi:hypothetical protein